MTREQHCASKKVIDEMTKSSGMSDRLIVRIEISADSQFPRPKLVLYICSCCLQRVLACLIEFAQRRTRVRCHEDIRNRFKLLNIIVLYPYCTDCAIYKFICTRVTSTNTIYLTPTSETRQTTRHNLYCGLSNRQSQL